MKNTIYVLLASFFLLSIAFVLSASAAKNPPQILDVSQALVLPETPDATKGAVDIHRALENNEDRARRIMLQQHVILEQLQDIKVARKARND